MKDVKCVDCDEYRNEWCEKVIDSPHPNMIRDCQYWHKRKDLVEVIRCEDCKYQDKGENESESWNLCGYRPWLYVPVTDDHYCGYAKQKDGEADGQR